MEHAAETAQTAFRVGLIMGMMETVSIELKLPIPGAVAVYLQELRIAATGDDR